MTGLTHSGSVQTYTQQNTNAYSIKGRRKRSKRKAGTKKGTRRKALVRR